MLRVQTNSRVYVCPISYRCYFSPPQGNYEIIENKEPVHLNRTRKSDIKPLSNIDDKRRKLQDCFQILMAPQDTRTYVRRLNSRKIKDKERIRYIIQHIEFQTQEIDFWIDEAIKIYLQFECHFPLESLLIGLLSYAANPSGLLKNEEQWILPCGKVMARYPFAQDFTLLNWEKSKITQSEQFLFSMDWSRYHKIESQFSLFEKHQFHQTLIPL